MRFIIIILSLFLCLTSYTQNEWEIKNSMPDEAEGRHHPITFSLDGYGYVLGGSGEDDDLNDMYKYDPTADSWSALNDFPGTARGYSYGAVAGEKAYVGFGRGQVPGGPVDYYNDLWEYDEINDTWARLADCPCDGRGHPAFVTTDTKIFIGLGNSNLGNFKDWWEYDIASNSWSQKPDFPAARRHHPYFFEIDGLVYVAFGHGDIIYNDLHVYNPETEEWKFLGFLPSQGRVAGAQFSYNGKGYVLSGDGDTHENLPSGELWSYDPTTNEWENLKSHPGPGRWAPGSFVIDDTAYFTGGQYLILFNDLLALNLNNEDVATKNLEIENFELYPNPSMDGLFHIEFKGELQKLEIYSMAGQYIDGIKPSYKAQIDLSHLEVGSYVVKLTTSDKGAIHKVIQIIE